MDVFELRDSVIEDYQRFIQGFLHIRDKRVRGVVEETLADGLLWPEPWLSLNPKFTVSGTVDELADTGLLDAECKRVFRIGKEADPSGTGSPLSLYRHQVEAIEAARAADNYVLTTGTGSGKSLAYIVPIVDLVSAGSGRHFDEDDVAWAEQLAATLMAGSVTGWPPCSARTPPPRRPSTGCGSSRTVRARAGWPPSW